MAAVPTRATVAPAAPRVAAASFLPRRRASAAWWPSISTRSDWNASTLVNSGRQPVAFSRSGETAPGGITYCRAVDGAGGRCSGAAGQRLGNLPPAHAGDLLALPLPQPAVAADRERAVHVAHRGLHETGGE